MAASPTPAPPLASQIGDRGGLPQAHPIDLAARFGRTNGRAAEARPFAGEANVGDTRQFSVLRFDAAAFAGDAPPSLTTVTATLQAKSAHAYFYADDAIAADRSALEAAAAEFESSAWPAVTSVFGTPATPGVDGDPRVIILQADLGGAVGGYVSGDDGYLRAVEPKSNEAEMVYLDRTLRPGGDAFNVVLAHELQHLIHGGQDAGEEAWVNEGLSETAAGLAGGALSSVDLFEGSPETRLTYWPVGNTRPHYGASAAFFRYLADRFGGDDALGAIARAQGDGTAGIDEFLASARTGVQFQEAFADWITANALNRADGPYGNPSRPVDVRIERSLAPGDTIDDEAPQFGTHYYLLEGLGDGERVVRFDGAESVPVLPASAGSATPVYWANAGDEIDTKLTREVDLTGATAPFLSFRTWYQIERWFDWGYIAVSTDGGATWTTLEGDQTTREDPAGSAYGAGYTGRSGGGDEPAWVEERIDLGPYAGQTVLLRFEYVTDSSTYTDGWAIADVAVRDGSRPLADGLAAWDSDGWVSLSGPLPQTYVVRVIAEREDGTPVVLDVPLDGEQAGELRFDATGLRDAVIAVAGTAEGTNQTAAYRLSLDAGG